jgi:hypothetical protein
MKNSDALHRSSFCSLRMLPHQCAQRLLLCFIILCFAAPSALAQTNTGQIEGVVRDQSGAVIPAATVTATHVASNLKVERVTDSSGAFLFPALAVGAYTLSVSANGFKQLTKTGRSSTWRSHSKLETST